MEKEDEKPQGMGRPSRSWTLRAKRKRRSLLNALGVLLFIAFASELLARFVLGLGDPPLFITDSRIEYLMKPSQKYRRVWNRMTINRWSMRSADFPRKKGEPSEYRVMVFGDSVIQGGMALDQPETATELLKVALEKELHRTVIVGNISAGSWGPPNMLAYAQTFGFFDADAVIIVLSSHDVSDVPTFEPLGISSPTQKPISALQQLARYLRRYLAVIADRINGRASKPSTSEPSEASEARIALSLDGLSRLIRLAKDSGADVALALHLERHELSDGPESGHERLKTVGEAAGATVLELGPKFEQAQRTGSDPYFDEIHPNKTGQGLMAKILLRWVVESGHNRRSTRN